MNSSSGTCANCDARIGRLEQPYQWQGQTVCYACHERLTRAAGSRPPAPAGATAAPPSSAAPPTAAAAPESVRWTASPVIFHYLPLYSLLAVLVLCALAATYYLHPAVILIVPLLLVVAGASEIVRRSVRYTITTRRVVAESGIINKKRSELRISNILEVTCEQTLVGRIFRFGSVGIDTAASDEVEVRMVNVPNPSAVAQILNSVRT